MDIDNTGHERQKPQSKKNKPKLATDEENFIVRNVERYINHGFPMKKEAQVVEIALLSLKELAKRNNEKFPKTVTTNWVQRFLQRHPDLENKFLESRDQHRATSLSSFRPDSDTVLGFLDVIDNARENYPFSNENVYTLGELGFIPLIRSEGQSLTISRPDGAVRSDRETRDFHSVVHCLTYEGKFLEPLIITKGYQKVSKKYLQGAHVVLNHKKGWADEIHLLEWVKRIFDPSTRGKVELDDEHPWRVLFVDGHHLDSYTEMEMLCFSMKILCLSFPRKSARIISPLYSTVLDAVGKSWADEFRRQFRIRKETHVQLNMKEFLSSIQEELSSDRETEYRGAWTKSCVVPPNRRALHRLLRGTQIPDTPSHNATRGSRTLASPARTETPSPPDTQLSTPDFEPSPNIHSPEYSPQPTILPIEEAFFRSSSASGTAGKRDRAPEYGDEPPSKRKFLNDLNSFEDATSPRDRQRYREEVITGFMSYLAQTESLKHTLDLMIRSATTPSKAPVK
ncbi:hypothetical protein N7478_003575 [Penicillium angulare]|uniref:uncharacterized protein n=1 Tax=Penicillium angulare TaxID=116970 RepID=UPI00254249B4|nr:uncharacterized protein N7478_003575 [Penicillium angulare]KAJ5287889.1 hypothetical protein N7478_003575 [Penicillium angulare]